MTHDSRGYYLGAAFRTVAINEPLSYLNLIILCIGAYACFFLIFMVYFQALFLAYGPSFKQNMKIEPFENIELYNLMTGIVTFRDHLH